MTFVVDASLSVKWFVPEEDSDQALEFFSAWYGRLHAPDLWLVEVAGASVKACNQQRASRTDALGSVARLGQLAEAVKLHRLDADLIASAARLAVDLGHPIQDCVYLALAGQLGCPLATSDVKFHDRAGDPSRVKLLAELV